MRNIKAYKLAIAVLVVLILSVNVAAAAPVSGQGGVGCEPVAISGVTVRASWCFPLIGRCGFPYSFTWRGVRVIATPMGWNLWNGQRVTVSGSVCSDGTTKGLRAR